MQWQQRGKECGFSPKPEHTTRGLTAQLQQHFQSVSVQRKKGSVLDLQWYTAGLLKFALEQKELTQAVTDKMQHKQLFLLPLSYLQSQLKQVGVTAQSGTMWQTVRNKWNCTGSTKESNSKEKYRQEDLKLSRNKEPHWKSRVFYMPCIDVPQLYLPGQPQFRIV